MSPHDDLDRNRLVSTRVRQLRLREGRARRVGFVVSIVVHIGLFSLYSGIAGPPTVTVTSGDGEGQPELQGLELLNLSELQEESEDLLRPEEPEIAQAPEREAVPVPVADQGSGDAVPSAEDVADAGAVEHVPEGPSAAERLRVRTNDERLWDFSDVRWSPSAETAITSELAWRIDLWADSMAAAMEREAGITDWTWTDEDGNRWGVSPGKLHLGSITLPLPFNFGAVPRLLEDQLDRNYVDAELRRNALTGLILETWDDRNEAIRRRRDAERAEQILNSGPRRTVPDSIRTGGGGGGGG